MIPIVLASGSASRRAILEGAGVPVTIERPRVDEDALKPGLADLAPRALALALAKAKALSVSVPGALVIGADQVMEFDGFAFDKPKTQEELKERLAAMAGRPHHLRGVVVVHRDGDIIETIQESSTLTMRDLSIDEIARYVDAAGEDVLATVGGYALEGLGSRLFSKIEGDFFSILGLPLFPVLACLRREGAITW
ncbi:MAG: Maf family protein [Pseudomonadota bacterium]